MQWWAGCPGMANPKFIVKEIGLVLGNKAWPTDAPPITTQAAKGGRK
jgi:hypothetical protein